MSVDQFGNIIEGGSIDQGLGYDNSDYIFSVFGNTTAWVVFRYDRNNNLEKTSSSGTGTVPDNLSTLTGLTYS